MCGRKALQIISIIVSILFYSSSEQKDKVGGTAIE